MKQIILSIILVILGFLIMMVLNQKPIPDLTGDIVLEKPVIPTVTLEVEIQEDSFI
jgi:hypothetical protein